ncbi:MAG TPA: lipid-binding SYLF domain-containing protein [Bryobacteraceae bacterium]|nr:lipid-binding SYLF domain-containing protein [Bryobacteraceae bacterium]
MRINKLLISTLMAVSAASPALFADSALERANKRIETSADVLQDALGAGDRGIPRDLIQKAQCVGVIPSLKRAGFIVGAQYGVGVVTCRVDQTRWSAPQVVRVEGGNFGLQIGGGETDFVFAIMNRHGMDRLMSDKFTIGADAAVMAGPVGRESAAQTDAVMKAEILSWSRSHGIFAGVTLNGATLRPDRDDNRALYGENATSERILTGKVKRPAAARRLYAQLREFQARG